MTMLETNEFNETPTMKKEELKQLNKKLIWLDEYNTDLLMLMDGLVPDEKSDPVVDKFSNTFDSVRLELCRLSGQHDWVNDQCGMEEHKFCIDCNTPMYPELVGMNCGAISELKEADNERYNRLHIVGFREST